MSGMTQEDQDLVSAALKKLDAALALQEDRE